MQRISLLAVQHVLLHVYACLGASNIVKAVNTVYKLFAKTACVHDRSQ